MNVEKTNLLVQDHHTIYDVSHCKYTQITYPAFSKKCIGQRLNIPNYSPFKLLGCPLILRLLSHKLFSNITVCKRSRLQFSIAVDWLVHYSKKSIKNLMDSRGIDWSRLAGVHPTIDSKSWLDSTRPLLVGTHPKRQYRLQPRCSWQPPLFWLFTQRMLVDVYRRCGRGYRSHLHGSSSPISRLTILYFLNSYTYARRL